MDNIQLPEGILSDVTRAANSRQSASALTNETITKGFGIAFTAISQKYSLYKFETEESGGKTLSFEDFIEDDNLVKKLMDEFYKVPSNEVDRNGDLQTKKDGSFKFTVNKANRQTVNTFLPVIRAGIRRKEDLELILQRFNGSVSQLAITAYAFSPCFRLVSAFIQSGLIGDKESKQAIKDFRKAGNRLVCTQFSKVAGTKDSLELEPQIANIALVNLAYKTTGQGKHLSAKACTRVQINLADWFKYYRNMKKVGRESEVIPPTWDMLMAENKTDDKEVESTDSLAETELQAVMPIPAESVESEQTPEITEPVTQ